MDKSKDNGARRSWKATEIASPPAPLDRRTAHKLRHFTMVDVLKCVYIRAVKDPITRIDPVFFLDIRLPRRSSGEGLNHVAHGENDGSASVWNRRTVRGLVRPIRLEAVGRPSAHHPGCQWKGLNCLLSLAQTHRKGSCSSTVQRLSLQETSHPPC